MRKVIKIIAVYCLFNILLLSGRIVYSESISFIFLAWNLFLAGVPLLIALFLHYFNNKIHSLLLFGGMAIWLLFLPNAPYILTDLFHLGTRPPMPIWFDLGLILSFALNALFMGFVSILIMHELIKKRFQKKFSGIFVYGTIVISSFGVYIGRYLRWNSWDILNHPQEILNDSAQILLNPFSHPGAWGLTLLFSATLILCYQLMIHIPSITAKESSFD